MFCFVVLLQVAPSCVIESDCAAAVEEALSSECVSRVYHPDVDQGPGGKAPHLALWHDEGEIKVMTVTAAAVCHRIVTKTLLRAVRR